METKLEQLKSRIAGLDSALVACSGGVDSTLLAYLAHSVLGDRALAVTISSPATPASEVEGAQETARKLGLSHTIVEYDPLANPDFVANGHQRCYHCKRDLCQAWKRIARDNGLSCVIEGTNRDDRYDHRPGMRALAEYGVLSPMAEAGLTKAEIRNLSRDLGLPNWDKPSSPCMATRIPHGTAITRELLDLVAKAEESMRDLGLLDFRVRHHGDTARIEASASDALLLADNGIKTPAISRLNALGYTHVTIDTRSGNTAGPVDVRRVS